MLASVNRGDKRGGWDLAEDPPIRPESSYLFILIHLIKYCNSKYSLLSVDLLHGDSCGILSYAKPILSAEQEETLLISAQDCSSMVETSK